MAESSASSSGRVQTSGGANSGLADPGVGGGASSTSTTGTPANVSRKTQAIYSSPSQGQMEMALDAHAKSQLEALIAKHSFPEDLDKALQQLRREDHEKRIKALRQELDHIQATQWQFEGPSATDKS